MLRAAFEATIPRLLGNLRRPVTQADMHVHIHEITTHDPKLGADGDA